MGSLRSAVKNFTGEDAGAAEAREYVKTLFELGKAKADLFEKEIKENLRTAGRDDNRTVPIHAILDETKEIHAYTSAVTNAHIGEQVTRAMRGFVEGSTPSITKGVVDLVSGALGAFLGEEAAGMQEKSKYFVLSEGRSIIRVDYKMWSMDVMASSIRKKIEKILVVVAVKSSVRLQDLDLNTFISAYQYQMTHSNISGLEVVKELQQIQEIYKAYTNGLTPSVPVK